ncbi:MAG TPA: STAS domain-containing protein [Desulfomonilia bacterium]|nr:STAS domain-containing protein [Desulfomonilia bacterium]
MLVAIDKKGDILIVKIVGAIDNDAAKTLRFELAEIAAQKPSQVVLDLSQVPAMGSIGIGNILMFFKTLQGFNACFEINGIHEDLYPFFKTTKLDRLFPISQ